MMKMQLQGYLGILACALLFVFSCSEADQEAIQEAIQEAAKNQLDLEYRCVEGSKRVLEQQTVDIGTRSLKSVYAEVGIEVTLRPPQIPECTKLEDLGEVTAECFPKASVHSWLYGGSGSNPPGVLKSGPDPQGAQDQWYAFGLALPRICEGSGDGAIFLNHLVPNGDIFCWEGLDYEPGYVREDFVVYTSLPDAGPTTPQPEFQSDSLLFKTELHELAHVLNTHHEELKISDDYEFEELMKMHLLLHRFDPDSAIYVEPGPQAAPWCCVPEEDHMDLHNDVESCDSLTHVVLGVQEAEHDVEIMPEWREDIEFRIEPEKPSYIVGEPVTITAFLDHRIDLLKYLGEISLDPTLGYLRVWTTRDSKEEKYWPPSHLLHADAKLTSVRLPERISAPGIDTWFDQHLPPISASTGAREYWIRAAYAGLEFRMEGSASGGRQVVVSEPLKIEEKEPSDEEKAVLHLFTSPEAKLFLFMLGGDHLEQGKTAMQTISEKYPKTIYAPYANLALGVNQSRPFYFYDAEADLIRRRNPEPRLALHYLDEARRRESDLPSSYKRELYQALVDVEVMQGDQSGSPEEAKRHYDLALRYWESLGSLPRPVSRTAQERRRDLQKQKEEIDQKIEDPS